jgi:hypothetical protein
MKIKNGILEIGYGIQMFVERGRWEVIRLSLRLRMGYWR